MYHFPSRSSYFCNIRIVVFEHEHGVLKASKGDIVRMVVL